MATEQAGDWAKQKPGRIGPSGLEGLHRLLNESERFRVAFAGTDAIGLLDLGDEHLAVTDLAGAGGGLDGFHHAVDQIVVDGDLDLHLGQEVHHVFGTTVDFGLSLLAAEALDFAHGQTLDAQGRQGLANLVELEGLDDGHDQLHLGVPMQFQGSVIPVRSPPMTWRAEKTDHG